MIFFLQVGYVRELNLIPGKIHKMKTLSMRPALFGKMLRVYGMDIQVSFLGIARRRFNIVSCS